MQLILGLFLAEFLGGIIEGIDLFFVLFGFLE
jgi:hypothetical protein